MGLRVYVMLASFINAARIYAKKIVTRVRASKNFKIDPFFFSKFGALGSGKRKILIKVLEFLPQFLVRVRSLPVKEIVMRICMNVTNDHHHHQHHHHRDGDDHQHHHSRGEEFEWGAEQSLLGIWAAGQTCHITNHPTNQPTNALN